MNLYISDNALCVYIFGVLGIWACIFILKIIAAIKLFNFGFTITAVVVAIMAICLLCVLIGFGYNIIKEIRK